MLASKLTVKCHASPVVATHEYLACIVPSFDEHEFECKSGGKCPISRAFVLRRIRSRCLSNGEISAKRQCPWAIAHLHITGFHLAGLDGFVPKSGPF